MTVRGLDRAIERVEGMATRARALQPAMVQIADELHDFVVERIQTRTAPDGTAWPERSRATVDRDGTKSSGELEKSVFASYDGGIVKYGATSPHAAYVHYGTKHSAPRPFLPYGTETEGPAVAELERYREIIRRYVLGAE